MVKYYLKDSEREVKIGDIIKAKKDQLIHGKHIHQLLECKVSEELIPWLLEEGIIEEEELDEQEPIDFNMDEEGEENPLEFIVEAIEALARQIDALTQIILKNQQGQPHKESAKPASKKPEKK